MNYNISHNDEIVTINIPVTNNDPVVIAHGVLATMIFPTGVSIYGTPIVTGGTYNTTTKVWTIGSLDPQVTVNLQLKVKIDNIDAQPFTIKTTVTIFEPESNGNNNIRYDVLTLNAGVEPCDPCNFIEPIIILNDKVSGLNVDLSSNNTIQCACCQKVYEIVGTPVNIVVHSILNGIVYYSYIDSSIGGSLQYRVRCVQCSNGLDYMSDISDVTFNALTSINPVNYSIKNSAISYTQEAAFDYFRFDTAANAITFTLLNTSSWVLGQSIIIYIRDSSQSGPLINNLTISTDGTFTETNLNTKVVTSNNASLTIVYVGSNKFDII